MTREEAIKYLKEMKDECNDTFHKVRYVTQEEVLDMAIQALVIIDKIEPMFGDMLDIPTQELMRDATPEERESIDKYIKGISKPTGIEFDKEQEPKTGHWLMRHRKVNTINYRTGEDVLTGEIHTVKELIRYETDEPYCAGCGKRAEDISQGYCGYCGARMDEPQEGINE